VDDKNQRMGSPKWVKLALDDGREIWYPGSDLGSVDHSYALTNHAVQGSEYEKVISVVTPGSPDFMNQNMILTAFSRAKSDLEIYGDPETLRKIAATPMPTRNSALSERVSQEMARLEEIESRDDVAEPVAGD
jgi:ATP-dependent exoDNAse (exonuclease V) alpha subunit